MTDNNLTDERTTENFRKISESVNEVAEILERLSDVLSDGEGDDVD